MIEKGGRRPPGRVAPPEATATIPGVPAGSGGRVDARPRENVEGWPLVRLVVGLQLNKVWPWAGCVVLLGYRETQRRRRWRTDER